MGGGGAAPIERVADETARAAPSPTPSRAAAPGGSRPATGADPAPTTASATALGAQRPPRRARRWTRRSPAASCASGAGRGGWWWGCGAARDRPRRERAAAAAAAQKTFSPSPPPDALAALVAAAPSLRRVVIVSGSGLSATAGMSTFSTPGGLYERAAKAARLPDGKALFTYAFFERRRADALAFLADVHGEAVAAAPTPGHRALAALAASGRLVRHYTLNVDGLAGVAGMTTWHHERNPDGACEGGRVGARSSARRPPARPPARRPPSAFTSSGTTVELHGNVRDLVCPECEAVTPATPADVAALRARRSIPCPACGPAHPLRLRVMLYEDAQGDAITPGDALDALEEDVVAADAVLWVGLSFEQSATTAYFRRARAAIAGAGRGDTTLQAVVNPADDAVFNLLSALANVGSLSLLDVRAAADDVLPALVEAMGVKKEVEEAVVAAAEPPAPPALLTPAALFPEAVADFRAPPEPPPMTLSASAAPPDTLAASPPPASA